MKKRTTLQQVVPINWTEESSRWLVIPGTVLENRKKRIKEVKYEKVNCLFAAGVPKSIIAFIYRAVKALNLSETKLIFSRGMVRTKKDKKKYAVSVRELDWNVGTLITIPRLLKYRETITLTIDGAVFSFRLMELVVLRGLLQIARPGEETEYYPVMAALVLARGWKSLELTELPEVYHA